MNKKSLAKGQTDHDLYQVANNLNLEIDDIDFVKDLFSEPLEDGNYIANLGNRNNGGTHWVGIILKGNLLAYFDPFGFRPPEIIVKYCKDNNIRCLFSMNQTQKLNEYICGLYCILYFLISSYHRVKDKKSFNEVLEEMKYWSIIP